MHQVQESKERVFGYYSKTLNSAQRNYCTTKKELLAIVAAFNQWDVYLIGMVRCCDQVQFCYPASIGREASERGRNEQIALDKSVAGLSAPTVKANLPHLQTRTKAF